MPKPVDHNTDFEQELKELMVKLKDEENALYKILKSITTDSVTLSIPTEVDDKNEIKRF